MGIEDRLLKQFEVHARKFDFGDEHISRKYYHSQRVMERAKEIAKSEAVSDEMFEAATVAGLLHDYSRFEQWKIYHTFRDALSIDHADRAAEILFDKGEITKFYDGVQNYKAIRDSIKYHNKYALPEDLAGDSLVLSRIVRDADKLDIIELLTWNESTMAEVEEPVSPVVDQCFFDGVMVDSHNARNGNDWIVLSLAMIYDLNYGYSFRYIAEHQLFEKIFENLKNKERFRKYFEYAEGVVGERGGG